MSELILNKIGLGHYWAWWKKYKKQNMSGHTVSMYKRGFFLIFHIIRSLKGKEIELIF